MKIIQIIMVSKDKVWGLSKDGDVYEAIVGSRTGPKWKLIIPKQED